MLKDFAPGENAETRDRTGDLQIFGLTLSQLSYRGMLIQSTVVIGTLLKVVGSSPLDHAAALLSASAGLEVKLGGGAGPMSVGCTV